MEVGSYLEIFTTAYGWAFGNIIGGVLASTGLIFIPFIWILLSTFKEAKEQGAEGADAAKLVNVFLTRVVVAMFVFTMAFATTPITSVKIMRYQPRPSVAEPNPTEVSNSGTDSTWDSAMEDAYDHSHVRDPVASLSNVPMWWYAVMSISSGINSAVIGSMTNRMSEVRELESAMRQTTIRNTKLLAEMQKFNSACLVPARSRYINTDPASISASGRAMIARDKEEYGEKELEWIGSTFFLEEPGFYDSIRPPFPVQGFAIDYSRDREYHNPAVNGDVPFTGAVLNPEYGRPTCKEWWSTSDIGLRDKMFEEANAGALKNFYYHSILSTEEDKNNAARLLSYKATSAVQYANNIGSQTQGSEELSLGVKVGRRVVSLLGSGSLFSQGLAAGGTMSFLMALLPMAQALALMALYMMLPIGTFLSGFSLRFMFQGAIAIFTIKFWTTLWEVAYWIDARMMKAMYPHSSWTKLFDGFVNMFEDGSMPGEKRLLLNILMMAMFIGFPLIWSSIMLWVGVQLGNAFTAISATGSGVAMTAGKAGGKAVSGTVSTAARTVATVATKGAAAKGAAAAKGGG